MNRARSRIGSAHLPRNLFAEGHAVNEMWLAATLRSKCIGRRVVRGQSSDWLFRALDLLRATTKCAFPDLHPSQFFPHKKRRCRRPVVQTQHHARLLPRFCAISPANTSFGLLDIVSSRIHRCGRGKSPKSIRGGSSALAAAPFPYFISIRNSMARCCTFASCEVSKSW